jgi:ABC-type multidrug transport system fused ATPase/permease subunit
MVSEKVSKYISLDPEGTFFQDEGITWDENLQEPVAIEFICKMPFPRLLGQRQDVPELDPTYVPIPGHIEDIRAGMYANQNIALSGPPGSGKSSLIQQLAAKQ